MNVEKAIVKVNKTLAYLLDEIDEFVNRQEAKEMSTDRELESLTITLTITEIGETHSFECTYSPMNPGGEYNI